MRNQGQGDESWAQVLDSFKSRGIAFTLADDRLAASGPSAKAYLDLIKESRGVLIVAAMCDRYGLDLASTMDFIGVDLDVIAAESAAFANAFGRGLQQQRPELVRQNE